LGLANWVFATDAIVLRVASDHPDAVPDARTESVAAPVAHQAGVRTPRLIAFDHSRALVDRPYSVWERMHGMTLGRVVWTKLLDGVGDLWQTPTRPVATAALRRLLRDTEPMT
jgi:hypothetical protein